MGLRAVSTYLSNTSNGRFKPLRFETLEERRLLTVSVINHGSWLEIAGSKQDDAVQVIENRDGTITVGSLVANGKKDKHGYKLYDFKAVKEVFAESTSIPTRNLKYIKFTGLQGNDLFRNQTSLRLIAYGGPGRDRIFGGSARDTIYGGAGRDFLDGGGNNDHLYGDDGKGTKGGSKAGGDLIFGGAGEDVIKGQNGSDLIRGDIGGDTIDGNDGWDLIDGGHGPDTIKGGPGHDVIEGKSGMDTADGGSGNDYLGGGDNADRLTGGIGNDCLFGHLGADTLKGGSDNDFLATGAAGEKDFADGGAGNNIVYGYLSPDKDVLKNGTIIEGSGDLPATGKGLPTTHSVCTITEILLRIQQRNPYVARSGKIRTLKDVRHNDFYANNFEQRQQQERDKMYAYLAPRLSASMAIANELTSQSPDASLLVDLPATNRVGEELDTDGSLSDGDLSLLLIAQQIISYQTELSALEERHAELVADLNLVTEFPEAKPEVRVKYEQHLQNGEDLCTFLNNTVAEIESQYALVSEVLYDATLIEAFLKASPEEESDVANETDPGDSSDQDDGQLPASPIFAIDFLEQGVELNSDWSVGLPIMAEQGPRHSLSNGIQVAELVNARWLQNPLNQYDVNRDQIVSPLDALLIISHLNNADSQHGEGQLATDPEHVYRDVSGDGGTSAIDALLVINLLNQQLASGEAEHAGSHETADHWQGYSPESQTKKKKRLWWTGVTAHTEPQLLQ